MASALIGRRSLLCKEQLESVLLDTDLQTSSFITVLSCWTNSHMDSPAQPHQLPQEILDIIIDDNSHDEAMHEAFPLVLKSFLLQSRRLFVRDIPFHGDDSLIGRY